ncbi:hypothetical protein Pla22_29030 [Rubripirellula amarantea]|uniref:Uncharacterized protein n=1 Tax=Rubripirellula amarantea TaxID=2527999 RepID=A0A5C5WJL7_9BACT|nr:hypothetical protein Pla22_29030 [Rubripirellula amarantea]
MRTEVNIVVATIQAQFSVANSTGTTIGVDHCTVGQRSVIVVTAAVTGVGVESVV